MTNRVQEYYIGHDSHAVMGSLKEYLPINNNNYAISRHPIDPIPCPVAMTD